MKEDALDEAYVEHDSAKLLINELEAAEPDEDFYDAKVKVLQELIEHHVKEEEKERDNLFQQTRAADIDLERWARPWRRARKAELTAQAEARTAPGRARNVEARRVGMAWTCICTMSRHGGAAAGLARSSFVLAGGPARRSSWPAAHSRGKTAPGPVGQRARPLGRPRRCATRPRVGDRSSRRRASRPAIRPSQPTDRGCDVTRVKEQFMTPA